jgi:uncharacterized protein
MALALKGPGKAAEARNMAVDVVVPAGDEARLRKGARVEPAVVALLALAIAARAGGVASGRVAGAELTFVSLVAESLPFLLVGAVLSALLSRPAATRLLTGAGRHPRAAAVLAPFVGVTLPLCDCGLLPLARRIRATVGDRAVGSFLAGAPLTNPVVIVTTLLAFPGQPGMAVARVLCGVAMAMAVAGLLTTPASACRVDHDHRSAHADEAMQRVSPLRAVMDELTRSGPVLVMGAAAAAVLKAVIPVTALTTVTSQPLLGALALMALAFVMSLCSQADAFVAAALPVGTLPRLAFLVLGPALDLRLAVLYWHSFGTRWVLRYAAVIVPVALVAATACTVAGLA